MNACEMYINTQAHVVLPLRPDPETVRSLGRKILIRGYISPNELGFHLMNISPNEELIRGNITPNDYNFPLISGFPSNIH